MIYNRIFAAAASVALAASAWAQDTVFHTFGMDTQPELDAWTQNVSEEIDEEGSPGWHLVTGGSFSQIDPTSTGSVGFAVTNNEEYNVTLNSPAVATAGHSGLVAGFYFKGDTGAFTPNMYIYVCDADDGWNSTTIWSKALDNSTDTGVDGWKHVRIALPSSMDGKNLYFQIYTNRMWGGSGNALLSLEFDNFYLAEKPAKDAAVSAVAPLQVASKTPVPVTVTVLNDGSQPFSEFTAWYRAGNAPAVQQAVSHTLAPGQTFDVTFDEPASFGTPDATYTLTGGVTLEGDLLTANNTKEAEVKNILTSMPYEPVFPDNKATDYWQTPRGTPNNWNLRYNEGEYMWAAGTNRNYEQDMNLISRPVYMSEGETGQVTFSYLGDSSYDKFGMRVYLASDLTDESTWTALWENVGFTGGRWSSGAAKIQAPSEGAYYVVFKALSAPSSYNYLFLDKIRIIPPFQYDLAVGELLSPSKNPVEYTDSETVTVRVANEGTLKAEGAQIAMTVDGKAIATESLPSLESGASADYTFTAKADLTGGWKGHTLTVNIVWESDQQPGNDSASYAMLSQTYEPPYETDLYTNDFAEKWTWTDNNADGVTFGIASQYGNDLLAFNPDSDDVAGIDETLYSSPIKLRAGTLYRIGMRPRVGINGESDNSLTVPFTVALYRKTDTGMELVQSVGDMEADWSSNRYVGVTPQTTGTYCIGMHFKDETAGKKYIRLSDFSVVPSAMKDASVTYVRNSGKTMTGYNKQLIRATVTNTGLTPFDSFTVKVSAPSATEISQTYTFDTPIGVNEYATVMLDELLTLGTATGDEDVRVSVTLEGDGNPGNDALTVTFAKAAPYALPLSLGVTGDEPWLVYPRYNMYSPQGGYYGGYEFELRCEGETPDRVASPAFTLEEAKTYRLRFGLKANNWPETCKVLDVKLLNTTDGSVTPLSQLAAQKDAYSYSPDVVAINFASPGGGTYVVCFDDVAHPEFKGMDFGYASPVTAIANAFAIEEIETADMHDIKLVAFTTHLEDGIYGKEESVKVTYKNTGDQTMDVVMFSLQAGDKTYHAAESWIEAGDEGEIEFTNVDLYNPGTYTLKACVEHGLDKTVADNTLELTVESHAIVNAHALSIDSPRSGDLGRHEHITVSVANDGKGTLSALPVSYTLTREGDGAQPVTVNEVMDIDIPEGETVQYTFKAEADFSVEGVYAIAFATNAPGDVDTGNDTVETKVNSTHTDMDAGVDGITGPTDALMGNAEYLVISVHNYGQADIFDVPVHATVKRGETEVAALSGQVSEIPAGKSVEYTFPTPFDMSMGGEYTVDATTALDRDVDGSNDSYTGTLYAYMVDCGVEEILSPSTTVPAGQTEITVKITNFGDAPVEQIPVYFKLGNNPQPGLYEGSIAPGESATYTFPNTYNFREGKEYTLQAYTALPTDMNPANDLCQASIRGVSSLEGVGSEGLWVENSAGAVTLHGLQGGEEVSLYTASGQLLRRTRATSGTLTLGVCPGTYLIRVVGDTSATLKALVK